MGAAAASSVRPRSALDAAAHDAYLKGMYALNKWTEQSIREAIAHFREAIAFDPGFAPAYAALAEGYVWLYSGLGIVSATEAIPPARRAIERALELDPDARRRAQGSRAHRHEPRLGSQGERRRPSPAPFSSVPDRLPRTSGMHGGSCCSRRRHDEALVELEEAERLNPLDLQVKTQIGYVHHFRHDVDRAIEQFERVLALEPSFAFAHYALGDACTQKG